MKSIKKKVFVISALYAIEAKKKGAIMKCTVGQKKRNTPIYYNTNYHTEMKLVPVIMDYSLLKFDA